jgi:hypothetical protein
MMAVQDDDRPLDPAPFPSGLCELRIQTLELPPGRWCSPLHVDGFSGAVVYQGGDGCLGVEIEREHYERARWRLHRAACDGNGSGGRTTGDGSAANPLDATAV